MFLGKDVNPDEVVDLGKNPLHILCMRRDFLTDNCSFFRDMISNFNDSDIDFNDRYLGHTPLSLAVLVGNQNLVETLMNLHIIDPHQVLGYNMGNVLTIYILKRYEDLIPRNAKKILDYLTMSGVNVLSPIGDFENAVAFMENEVSKDKQRSKSIKILKQTPANDQTKNDVLRKALRKHIKELGRQTIKKYIQSIAVENLYNLIEDNLTEHECVSTLAGFLTPKITISNLQILFEHGKFKPGRFDKNICLKLIDIVKTHSKINQKNSKSKSNSKIITNTSDYNLILDTFTIRRMEKEETELELLPPGLDDTSKYKVCYHCLRKRNKLLVCPKCQLIYFCSDLCNKANLKLENVHPCRTDFYASELKRLTSPNALEEQENLEGLYKRVQDSCEKRRLQNLQKGFELGRKHYKDGIKFSKSHVLKTKIKITPTMISLLGSVSSLSKTDILYHDNLSSTINKTYSESVRFDQSTKDTSSEIKNRLPIISLINRVCNKKNPNCDCEICTAYKKQAWKIKCKCLPVGSTKKTVTDVKVGEVDTNVTVRKLRVAPKQCKEFIKLLTQKCPNIDFSSVILPYTCYSNGNLYYKFLDNDYYTRMYDVDGNYQ